MLQIYAAIEDTGDDDKDTFYNQLQDTINDTPSHDVKLLLGDFNAQIDGNRQVPERVIGPHGTARHF